MNVFWMLLRGWLLHQQHLQQQALVLENRVIVYPKASAKQGQAIVEYSGALVVSGILVVAVISKLDTSVGKWFVTLLTTVSKSVQQWL